MQEIIYCPKLQNGFMGYYYNEKKQYYQLVSDIPEKGEKGARFDNITCVPLSEIEDIIKKQGTIKTYHLAQCFSRHSGNNAPMLVAALVNDGRLIQTKLGNYKYNSAA